MAPPSTVSHHCAVQSNWPVWWEWELELSPHVHERMEDRNFTEVELRQMVQDAIRFRPDVIKGRWVIETRFRQHRWEVIVEPKAVGPRLTVITAYPVAP